MAVCVCKCVVSSAYIVYSCRVQQWKWNTIQLENANKKKNAHLHSATSLVSTQAVAKLWVQLTTLKTEGNNGPKRIFPLSCGMECYSCFSIFFRSFNVYFLVLFSSIHNLPTEKCKFVLFVLNIKWYTHTHGEYRTNRILYCYFHFIRETTEFQQMRVSLSAMLGVAQKRRNMWRFPFWLIIFTPSDMVFRAKFQSGDILWHTMP